MQHYSSSSAGYGVGSTRLLFSPVDESKANHHTDCWKENSIPCSHTNQAQANNKIDDVFSRMTLWNSSQGSASHNQNSINLRQREQVDLPSWQFKSFLSYSEYPGKTSRIAGVAAPINPELSKKLYALKNKTVQGQLLYMKASDSGGFFGGACYQPDSSMQLKIRFIIPGRVNNKIISTSKLQRVQGTFYFSRENLNRYLEENGAEILQKAFYQKAGSSPFYFLPGTINLMPYPNELSGDKAFIFDHIKSLAHKTITAELLRVNFRNGTSVAWYDFSTAGKTYGTPVAFKTRSLPGYENQPDEKLAIYSSRPIFQVTGQAKVDEARLYRDVLENCPPYYIRKRADSPEGLPVFMVNDSIRIVASKDLQKVQIQTQPGVKVLMKYPCRP